MPFGITRCRGGTAAQQTVLFGQDAALFGELVLALFQGLLALVELRGTQRQVRADRWRQRDRGDDRWRDDRWRDDRWRDDRAKSLRSPGRRGGRRLRRGGGGGA